MKKKKMQERRRQQFSALIKDQNADAQGKQPVKFHRQMSDYTKDRVEAAAQKAAQIIGTKKRP